MKRNQHISILFLTAIMLVLAHGIIPHHHFDESCFVNHCVDNKAPADPIQKHPKLPWHCQAYNHVVFTEQQLLNKFKIFDPKLCEFSDFVVTVNLYLFVYNSCLYGNTSEPATSSCFLPQPPLRAPPELS